MLSLTIQPSALRLLETKKFEVQFLLLSAPLFLPIPGPTKFVGLPPLYGEKKKDYDDSIFPLFFPFLFRLYNPNPYIYTHTQKGLFRKVERVHYCSERSRPSSSENCRSQARNFLLVSG